MGDVTQNGLPSIPKGDLAVVDATGGGNLIVGGVGGAVGGDDVDSFTVGIPDQDGCRDLNPSCPGWGELGQCDANPAFMLVNCPITCDSCQPLSMRNSFIVLFICSI